MARQYWPKNTAIANHTLKTIAIVIIFSLSPTPARPLDEEVREVILLSTSSSEERAANISAHELRSLNYMNKVHTQALRLKNSLTQMERGIEIYSTFIVRSLRKFSDK